MANVITERTPQIIAAEITVLKIRPAECCFTALWRLDNA